MCGIKNCKGHKNIPKTIFIQASPSSSEDELEEEGISLPKPKNNLQELERPLHRRILMKNQKMKKNIQLIP